MTTHPPPDTPTDEPDSDWLPPVVYQPADPHEGEAEWRPLPIPTPEGDEDVDL